MATTDGATTVTGEWVMPHPSTEERVARLNEMQRQMEQAHYNG